MTKLVGSLADAFRLVFEHMEEHPDERVTVALGGEPCGTLPSWNELKEGACQHLTVIDTKRWSGGEIRCWSCGGPTRALEDEYGGLSGGGDYERFVCVEHKGQACADVVCVEMPVSGVRPSRIPGGVPAVDEGPAHGF